MNAELQSIKTTFSANYRNKKSIFFSSIFEDVACIKHLHFTCISKFLRDFCEVFVTRRHCRSEPENTDKSS